MTTLFIGNLPDHSDESHIRRLLETFGKVSSLQIVSCGPRHRFDNFALVEMTKKAANKVIKELHSRVFEGAILCVQEATEAQMEQAGSPATRIKDNDPVPSYPGHRLFEVTKVEKTEGPGGAEGDDWYRYELSHGTSRITGYHRGTLEEVTEFATESSVVINERSMGSKTRPAYRSRPKN